MLTVAGGIILAVVGMAAAAWLVKTIHNLFYWFWKDGYYYHDRAW
jgi:hypothetical protein